jgi:hypothetical protein
MSSGTFIAQPGTDFASGQEPAITRALRRLSALLGRPVYGISGARTPAHSVEVGGFANDPHTRGQAADVGLGAPTRDSFAGVTDKQLAAVGLYRPFKSAAEVNHVQLMPGQKSGGGFHPLHILEGAALVPALAPVGVVAAGAEVAGITSAPADAIGAATGAAAGLAGDVADALLGKVIDAIGRDLVVWALYAGLVLGGLFLIYHGSRRVVGAS